MCKKALYVVVTRRERSLSFLLVKGANSAVVAY